MTKRYAIKQLRVHTASRPLLLTKNCKLNCDDCNLYGDTKEQLINKIATALARTTKDGDIVIYEDFGTGLIESISTVKNVAKEIVEFLGVKE